MDKKNVAIVGANGQIGIALINSLILSKEFKPIAIVRSTTASSIVKMRIDSQIEIRVGDIKTSTSELLLDCSIVVNAALASGNGYSTDRITNKSIFKSISQVENVKKFIHLSSIAIYGLNKKSNFLKPKPYNSYGHEKLFHEKYLKKLYTKKNKNLIILRVGHLFGAGTPMSNFILNCLIDKKFKLINHNLPSNFISRPRLVNGIVESFKLQQNINIYNLTDDPNLNYESIYKFHCEAFKMELPPIDDNFKLIEKRLSKQNNLIYTILLNLTSGIKSFSYKTFFDSQSFRTVLEILLSISPKFLEDYIRLKHKNITVIKQISKLNRSIMYADILFWPAVQGPQIEGKEVAAELLIEKKLLAEWYESITRRELGDNYELIK